MYPPLPNCHSTQTAVVELPDGRRVRAREEGYHEGDTGAWVETSDLELTWDDDDGEELAEAEVLMVVEHEGKSYTLVEYVSKFALWQAT